jgi:hypothetical protein
MTFLDKYEKCDTWHERVTVMALYHIAMNHRRRDWSLIKTAAYFGVSIGLASENIKLANALTKTPSLTKCETRQAALDKLK